MFDVAQRNGDRTANKQHSVSAILESTSRCRRAIQALEEGMPRGLEVSPPASSADLGAYYPREIWESVIHEAVFSLFLVGFFNRTARTRASPSNLVAKQDASNWDR